MDIRGRLELGAKFAPHCLVRVIMVIKVMLRVMLRVMPGGGPATRTARWKHRHPTHCRLLLTVRLLLFHSVEKMPAVETDPATGTCNTTQKQIRKRFLRVQKVPYHPKSVSVEADVLGHVQLRGFHALWKLVHGGPFRVIRVIRVVRIVRVVRVVRVIT